MKAISVLLLMLASILTGSLRAQTLPYFHFFDTPGYEIRDMCRDNQGLLWFATTIGLRNYTDLLDKRISLRMLPKEFRVAMGKVQCDSEGRIWCSADVGSFMIYDPRTNMTIDNAETLLQSWGMSDGYTYWVVIDNRGRIWVQKGALIYRYDPVTRTLDSIKIEEEGAGNWRCSFLSQGDRAYLCTKHFLYHIHIESMAIVHSERLPFNNMGDVVMMEDTGHNLWLAHKDEVYCHPEGNRNWELSLQTESSVHNIVQLDEQTICAASASTGIYLIDMRQGTKTVWTNNPLSPGSLQTNHINSLYVDEQGCLMVALHKRGLSIYNPHYKDNYTRHLVSLQSRQIKDDILCSTHDDAGKLWIGTADHGIHILTPGKENNEYQWPTETDQSIISLLTDKQGRIWAGVYVNGLFCYDNGKRHHYFGQASPFSIAQADNGMLFAGIHGIGVGRVNPETGSETVLSNPDVKWIMGMKAGKDGKIYAATTEGLQIIDPETLQYEMLTTNRSGTQSFARKVMRALVCDKRKLVWVLCDCGVGVVNVFDTERDTILTIPALENYDIISMTEDKSDNLWMASSHGLVKVEVEECEDGNYKFHAYNYTINSTANYNYSAAHCLPDGRLLFGTFNGYQLIDPRSLETLWDERREAVTTFFSSLKINNIPVMAGEKLNDRILLDENISYTRKLVLKHNENNLELELCPKSYGIPFKQNYVYRLLPLQTDFFHVNNHTLTFYNLLPGNYQLQVKELNQDNKACASMEITVQPPWWQSTVAYTSYSMLFLLSTFVFFRYWHHRQKYKIKLKQVEMEADRQYQINEMKLRFFTNVSHDFRTPLSLIIMPLSDLMERITDPDLRSFLKPIHRNAQRLLELVNQILDFRKLEVYGSSLNLSYGDIVSFIREVCTSFSMLADDNRVHLVFRSSVERLETSFDKDKLTKIMMNLLSNAFKYTTNEGEIAVEIEVWNKQILIKVADTGLGISDADKPHIFDRFYQVGKQNGVQAGSGIGLHIVREFVELYGGEVSVADNLPKGSVFTVTLPIQKELDSNPLATDILPDKKIEDIPADGHAHTLLLVEDNPDFLAYMTRTFSDEYHVIQARHGKEALEILSGENVVDVVVSDVMMNEMDGLTLCHTLKSNIETSHIPVILLTAKVLEEDELKGLEMGANDYITKPFNISILRQRIRSIIEYSRHSHERFKQEIEVSPSDITITSLDQQFISSAIDIVEKNIENPEFSVEMLSTGLNMHRSYLYKKLLFIIGKTPLEFIRLIRLKRAKQLMEQSGLYVSEIAYRVGFNSPRIFAKYFKEEYGMLPSDYIKENGTSQQIASRDIKQS